MAQVAPVVAVVVVVAPVAVRVPVCVEAVASGLASLGSHQVLTAECS